MCQKREYKAKKRPEFSSTLQRGDRDWWVGQWEGQVASTSKLLLMNYWETMKEPDLFYLCVSLCTSHLFSLYLFSTSLSPSCHHGIEPPSSHLPTCERTCSPLGPRAPKASETPLWKVGGWFLLGWYFWTESDQCFTCLSFFSDADPTLCGIERQRPGSLSSALGGQSHAPSFPALPRPSGLSHTGYLVYFLFPILALSFFAL